MGQPSDRSGLWLCRADVMTLCCVSSKANFQDNLRTPWPAQAGSNWSFELSYPPKCYKPPPATCPQLIGIKVTAVHTYSFIPLPRHSRDLAKDSHSCRRCFRGETGNNEVNQRAGNLIATSDKYREGNKQDIVGENVYERCSWKGLLALLLSFQNFLNSSPCVLLVLGSLSDSPLPGLAASSCDWNAETLKANNWGPFHSLSLLSYSESPTSRIFLLLFSC